MNKLPTKQIYLLSVIVIGLITLSVYSTYAIFTFESSTDSVVSINTPNDLSLATSLETYRMIHVDGNKYVTTDIDIYNNFEYNLCYSVWYNVIENESIDKSKVKLYEITDASSLSNNIIDPVTSRRIKLMVINDNETPVDIKFGLIYEKNNNTCTLNIPDDKVQISKTINNPELLSKKLIDNVRSSITEENYLTYKNIEDIITLEDNKTIYIATEFTYHNELFTLKDPVETNTINILNDTKDKEKTYYTCLYSNTCIDLIKINEIKETEKDNTKIYDITNYDILKGYSTSESGLRKVGNDYYFYGDNPNNFVYYNCLNESDSKTCELWRILGFTYDELEKEYNPIIIRDSSIGLFDYSDSETGWKESNINKYLTKDYKLLDTSFLKKTNFKQEKLLDLSSSINDIDYETDEYEEYIRIIKLSDFLHTSSCDKDNISEFTEECIKTNWLNKNTDISDWTMTFVPDEFKNEVYTIGRNMISSPVSEKLNVHPVLSLKNRVFTTDGDGTIDNPYKIR